MSDLNPDSTFNTFNTGLSLQAQAKEKVRFEDHGNLFD
jgi:hypothetical protein